MATRTIYWTSEAVEYLQLHYHNTETAELAKAFDITVLQVRCKASALSLKKDTTLTDPIPTIVPIKIIETIPAGNFKKVKVAGGGYINVADHMSTERAQALFSIYHNQ